jgi:hypothetical protein
VGQHLGGLYSGRATDLNSAPLLILMGAAIVRPRLALVWRARTIVHPPLAEAA